MYENLPQRECKDSNPKTVMIEMSEEAQYFLCDNCASLEIFAGNNS